ncbi:MAG: hypothetical protein ACLR7Z_12290 [Bilophila wadsworthia]
MPAGIASAGARADHRRKLIVTLYRTQAEDSLADLLVFSPFAALFMAAHLAIVIPLWLNHCSRARASPSPACARPERACAATTFGSSLRSPSAGLSSCANPTPSKAFPAISRRPCTPPSSAWGSSSC